jgi:hypothetical protein
MGQRSGCAGAAQLTDTCDLFFNSPCRHSSECVIISACPRPS